MRTDNADSGVWYVCLISSVAALGGFLFGFDSGVINGTIDALADAFGSGAVGTGFSVSSILLGCAVGALFAGTIADRIGRRPTMIATAIVFIASALGSGLATTATEFVLYRLLGGLGVGAASVLAPAYISEVAPAHLRGRLASLQQLAIVVGLVGAFFSNYLLASLSGGAAKTLWLDVAAWRWMFWAEVVPAALFLFGSLLIPESPRFLVAQRRETSALLIFQRIVGQHAEQLVIQVRRSLGATSKRSLRDLLVPGSRRLVPVLWIGIGLSAFQQLVGINVVFYYGSVLWQSAGFGEGQALWTNVITGTTNVLATFLAIALVDRIGRKPLLLIGSAGMMVTLAILSPALLNWGRRRRRRPAAQRHKRSAGSLDRQPVRGLLRRIMGPGGLGSPRRNVQQPHTRGRLGRRRCCPVDCQLLRHHDLPEHARKHRAGRGLRGLRQRSGRFLCVRLWLGVRDPWPQPRGDALTEQKLAL